MPQRASLQAIEVLSREADIETEESNDGFAAKKLLHACRDTLRFSRP